MVQKTEQGTSSDLTYVFNILHGVCVYYAGGEVFERCSYVLQILHSWQPPDICISSLDLPTPTMSSSASFSPGVIRSSWQSKNPGRANYRGVPLIRRRTLSSISSTRASATAAEAHASSVNASTRSRMRCDKVSHNGSSSALFIECLDKIRQTRINVENNATQNIMLQAKAELNKLTNEEIHLVRQQFQRLERGNHLRGLHNVEGVEPDTTERRVQRWINAAGQQQSETSSDGRKNGRGVPPGGRSAVHEDTLFPSASASSQLLPEDTVDHVSAFLSLYSNEKGQAGSYSGYSVDPYWDPFFDVQNEKERANQEFAEYAKVASAAEAREKRMEIRRSIRRAVVARFGARYDPLKYNAGNLPQDVPKPHRLHERFWTPSVLQQRINAEKQLSWRDVDILQHHLAPNGWILPRRSTLLSRKQHRRMAKAVHTARAMALLPFDWRPRDFEVMPLMDPMQFAADRLSHDLRNPRSRAMLEVMLEKYPNLDYTAYQKWKRALFQKCKSQDASSSSSGGQKDTDSRQAARDRKEASTQARQTASGGKQDILTLVDTESREKSASCVSS
ncbi:unnamed protein product [Amoebophrya sp. A25]|nr:unnamed protein product [Amoebophrya sp. A25]|eukprot:GSA25T00014249001.1